MRHAAVAVTALGMALGGVQTAAGQPFPPSGSPNPAMTGAPARPAPASPTPAEAPAPTERPAPTADAPPAPGAGPPPGGAPRAVTVARATAIPNCTVFVDAGAAGGGSGTAQKPHKTIAAAVAAAKPGAVICVAEGVYAETLKPGEKHFTLAGGFQRGKDFKVRDSAAYVSKAQGKGGSFLRIEDPGPKGDQLTAIDGFEIAGYAQAIVREYYEPQRFDLTNNHIHDNNCQNDKLVGAAFSLNNVSGTISGNVIRKNACGRGGGGSLYDDSKKSVVLVSGNLVDGNSGTEPDSSHGGGLYLFANRLTVTGNLFTDNRVTQWGGGLYIGAWTAGGHFTNARMSWNVYRGNRAGNSGGGFFCDDAANCVSEHEVYAGNCGGNILLDGGEDNSAPSSATFDHVTVIGALEPDCKEPGVGVLITKAVLPAQTYTFTNALFWNNAPGKDFAAYCDAHCSTAKITVTHSMAQTNHAKQNMSVAFGAGIMKPEDPLFADPEKGDFHLKSAAGRWTPAGYVKDDATSPALAKGDPRGPADKNPERAGKRSELGAYGNSAEASFVR